MTARVRLTALVMCAACYTQEPAPPRSPVKEPVRPRPASVARVDAHQVRGGGTITGRVVHGNTPVRDFGVVLARSWVLSYQPEPLAIHSETGRFEITGVRPGTWDLVIAAPGLARTLEIGITVPARAAVSLGDIALRPGFTIDGVVVDTTGRPIGDATVSVVQDRESDDPLTELVRGNLRAHTDASGRFRIPGYTSLALTGPSATVTARSRSEGVSYPERIGSGDLALTLTVHPSAIVEGTVALSASGLAVLVTPVLRPRAGYLVPVEARAYRLEVPEGAYDVHLLGTSRGGTKRVLVLHGAPTTVDFP